MGKAAPPVTGLVKAAPNVVCESALMSMEFGGFSAGSSKGEGQNLVKHLLVCSLFMIALGNHELKYQTRVPIPEKIMELLSKTRKIYFEDS